MNSVHLKPLTRQARLRERRRLAGLCYYCTEKATHGVSCERHAREKNEKQRKRAAAVKAKGLCIHCGRPVEDGRTCHNRNECVPSRRIAQ